MTIRSATRRFIQIPKDGDGGTFLPGAKKIMQRRKTRALRKLGKALTLEGLHEIEENILEQPELTRVEQRQKDLDLYYANLFGEAECGCGCMD